MIVSASRRTDIPAFYSDWLLNRVCEGYVKTKNPFNRAQIRTISLKPEDVDCFVFWTKNPAALLPKLHRLDAAGHQYYFQFTLTPYAGDLEPGLPPKQELIETFQRLCETTDRRRVIWRYDPVLLSDEWDIAAHRNAFRHLCAQLGPYTERVTISFVDMYKKMRTDQIRAPSAPEMEEIAACFSDAASPYGLGIFTCCEQIDLTRYGIRKAACIDRALIEQIIGKPLSVDADPNQRSGCGCCRSVDIGAYNTCGHGCVYCYANHSAASTGKNMRRHNPTAEFLLE